MHPLMRRVTLRFLVWPEVKEVCAKLLGRQITNASLREVLASKAFNLPFDKYHVRDFTALVLYIYIRESKPEVVIETGISSGRSSTTILEALEKNGTGKLYSIDLPKLNNTGVTSMVSLEGNSYRQYIPQGEKEPGWLVPHELKHRWVKILGDSNVELPKLIPTLTTVDIFFHDGDHTDRTMMHEFTLAWPKLPPGGVLFADDVPASKAFDDFSSKNNYRNRHVYNGLGILQKP